MTTAAAVVVIKNTINKNPLEVIILTENMKVEIQKETKFDIQAEEVIEEVKKAELYT